MKNNLIRITLMSCLLCLFMGRETFAADQQTITSGDWKIVYNNDTKTCDFIHKGKTILAGVFVQAKDKDQLLRSTEYGQPTFSEEAVDDVFGAGHKYTFTYAGQEGAPSLQQLFYFYPDKSYFLTEAFILSEAGTSSNYIAPVVTETVNSFLNTNTSNRVLSVPFDNDAWIGYSSLALSVDSVSFEVTSFYCGDTREGLVIGSVEHDTWKTGVRYSTSGNQKVNRLECFGGISHRVTHDIDATGAKAHGSISGTKLKSPKLLIGMFDDWREGLEAYGEANALIAPPRKWSNGNIFGWNSWGAMAEKLNYEGVLDVSDYISTNLQPNNFTNDGTAYVILDSYWDNLTDTQLKSFAERCVANGQVPGIYWAPFSDWGENGSRTMEGSNYKYGEAYLYVNGQPKKIASRALDPTHPGTRQRMSYFINRFKDLGYKYIKFDFLNNAILEADSYYDKNVTTGVQAYNSGMKYLTELCGDDLFMALSIAPAFPAQYGNSRRISCDAWGAKEDTEYVMNGLSYGWWLNKVYNFNDADHLVLHRDDYNEDENRMRITSGVITGTYILGDNFSQKGTCVGELAARQKAEKFATNAEVNEVARIGKSFYPVEGAKASGKNSWGRNRGENLFMLDTEDYLYVAAFNYKDLAFSENIKLSRLGIASSDVKGIKELWTGQDVSLQGEEIPVSLPEYGVKLYKIEKKGTGTGLTGLTAPDKKITGWVKDDHLFIQSEETLKGLFIYSAQGTLVKKLPALYPQARYDINIADLPKGMFFVQAVTSVQESECLKFVK